MKRQILITLAMALAVLGASAQYFGTPFYTEGFDTQEAIKKWTVETTLASTGGSATWHYDTSAGYESVIETSTASLGFALNYEDKTQSTITSPVIPTDGRKGLVVGFSAYKMHNLSPSNNIMIFFEAKAVGQETWTEVYRTNTKGTPLGYSWSSWCMNMMMLGAEFDGKDIQLRFRVEASDYSGYSKAYCAIDGVFLSQLPAYDAQVSAISPANNAHGAYGANEDIAITVKNAGLNSLENMAVTYKILDKSDDEPIIVSEVSETFAGPIDIHGEATYTFTQKADFSVYGKTYDIEVSVNVAEDLNHDNDTLAASFANSIATVPYKPTFRNEGRPTEDFWYIGDSNWFMSSYWTLTSKASDISEKLISRPIIFEANKPYNLKFAARYGEDLYGAQIEAFYTTDPTGKSDLVKICDLNNIGAEDAIASNSFTVNKSDYYYIVFVGNLKGTESRLWLELMNLEVFETYEYDIAVKDITAPAKLAFDYGTNETIKVLLKNVGLKTAEGVQVTCYVDEEAIATETLPAIESATEYEYTFTATADLSTRGGVHNIKVVATWSQDVDNSNNEFSSTTFATVTAPPYKTDVADIKDFGSYWSYTDNNNDGIAIQPISVNYSYRLGYVPTPEAPATTTDESIYSRPLKMNAGKTYRIEPRFIIEKVEGKEPSYHIDIDLTKKNESGEYVKVLDIHEQDYSGWETYYYTFDVDTDAVYYIRYNITCDTPTDYYFHLAEFNIVETAHYDIAIQNVSIPGTKLSAYNTLPVKVKVSNNGIDPFDKFKVLVSSPSMETYEEEFVLEKPLATNSQLTVSLSKELKFAETEKVTFNVVLEADPISDNNSYTINIESIGSLDVPVSADFDDQHGWLAIDRDKNGYGYLYTSWYKEYSHDLTHTDDGDEFVSRSINMQKDKIYKVRFGILANEMDESYPIFEVYAVNCNTLEKTLITTYNAEKDLFTYNYEKFIGYVTIPEDGEYSIVIKALSLPENVQYDHFELGDKFKVEEVSSMPDIELVDITTPAEDAIFTENEEVVVSYKNAGSVEFGAMSFTLTVGENKYYAVNHNTIAAGAEGSIKFTGVNLNEPTEYVLSVKAESYTDATIENNTLTKTIKSLPIIDMALLSLDAPISGQLSKEETVIVTLTNKGKGTITNIPISYIFKDVENDAVSLSANEIIAGPIAVGDTIQYTFTTPVDLSKEATYSFTVSIDIEEDIFAEDNSKNTSVASTYKPMDAGVAAIVGPTNRLMTNSEYLVIAVKNYGEGTLYDVPVSATISKNENTIATLSGSISEILAGETVEYTFTNPIDIELGGYYDVSARTELNNDIDNENDEFTDRIYSYMIDCGIESIISPSNTVVEGETSITVIIKNYGDVDVTDVPVRFKTGNVPQSGLYSGTIAVGESVEYTFPNAYNFRLGREYTLTAYTEYEYDMNPDNDATSVDVNVISGLNDVNNNNISVYANNGAIVVETENPEGTINVCNMNGSTIAYVAITDHLTTIDVEQGLYIIMITTNDGNAIYKIIVK